MNCSPRLTYLSAPAKGDVMEIRTLRYFIQIARDENITKAAEYLHISQPTLSRQIQSLEDELGKKLFHRHSHHITLTDEGILLRQRAEEILSLVDKTADEFASMDDIAGGDVRIGCAESEGMKFFIEAANRLHARYPRIRFHFYSSDTEAIAEKLDRGLLDMAVIVQPVDLTKYNYLRIPFEDRWGLLLRKDHPLAEKSAIELEDVLHLPVICSHQGLKDDLLDWFGEKRKDLNVVATYDLIFNASIMAREGLGCVLGLDGLVYTGAESDLCFRPLSPAFPSPLYVIWKKYQVFTPVAQLLIDELKRELS